MSSPEMNILGNDNIRKTNSIYWLGSPRDYNNVWADINAISRTGTLTYSSYNTILGLRPAISLTPGIEYSDGDGSMANLFVVKMN